MSKTTSEDKKLERITSLENVDFSEYYFAIKALVIN